MLALGIDPGSRISGFALVEYKSHKNSSQYITSGLMLPSLKANFSDRLRSLYQDTIRLMEDFNPDVLILERSFVIKDYPDSGLKLGHVRGVFMAAAYQYEKSIYEYSPNQVKHFLTGSGHAKKAEVQKMIQYHFKLDQQPTEDASDALALCVFHVHSQAMNLTQFLK